MLSNEAKTKLKAYAAGLVDELRSPYFGGTTYETVLDYLMEAAAVGMRDVLDVYDIRPDC